VLHSDSLRKIDAGFEDFSFRAWAVCGYQKPYFRNNKEIVMKRTNIPTTLVIIFTTVIALGIAPRAQADEHDRCSNATLRGSFGYTSTGTLLDTYVPPPLAGPFAEVGKQTFDGRGKTEATATLSTNGNPATVTVEGTYAVNPDCTGSMTLHVSPFGSTVHAYFVIDNDGAEFRAIVTDPNLIESRVYARQFQGGHQGW
jgi:hypothetical protein